MSGPVLDRLPVQPTSFVGREGELAAVAALLRERRLVTLTGSAGLGKTRLAVEVAARAAPESEVWFLPLAEGVEPDLGIAEALAGRRALVVVDGCDRWLGSGELVRVLLAACPELRVLATGLEPLGLAEEAVFRLTPLAVPDPDAPLEVVVSSEAVRLFWARVLLARPGFRITPENAGAVAALCRRLEGIPLAIELAAASADAAAPDLLLEQMEPHLDFQAPLRRTLEWDHAQLSAAERVLFRRLGAFAGGFESSAVLAVCAGGSLTPADVSEHLAALERRSLVVPSGRRSRMLEPVRRFAARQLAASGEEAAVRDRHAAYFADLAERAAQTQGRALVWLDRMEAEHENLLAAMAWWRSRDRRRWVAMVLSMGWFWLHHAYLSEGREWLERLLAEGELEPRARGHALYWLARLRCWQGDYEESIRLAEEALALQRRVGDDSGAGWTLSLLGSVRGYAGDLDGGRRELEWLSGHSEGVLRADALLWLGELCLLAGDLAGARAALQRALEEARRESGDVAWHTLGALLFLAIVTYLEGDPAGALRLAGQALDLGYPAQNPYSVAGCLDVVAAAVFSEGHPERALQLAAAADRIRAGATSPLLPGWRRMRETMLLEPARAAAGDAAEAAWRQGAAMGLEEAVAAGLAAARIDPVPSPRLSPREEEVARLVADGLTNREIGSRLRIAERTVESHLDSIRAKLGVRTRTQVAVWLVGQRAAQRRE